MSIGPIPAWAIWQWEDRNGIRDPRVRQHVEDVITAIDAITLRRANRPRAPRKENAEKAPRSKR